VAQLVETLRYKAGGRGFDSRWDQWNFSLAYPSGRTMALGSTHPQQILVSGIFPGGFGRTVKAAHCRPVKG
jgi:hypothetical protein